MAQDWHADAKYCHADLGGVLCYDVHDGLLAVGDFGMNSNTYQFYTPPPAVGGYRMGDHTMVGSVTFSLPTKPHWFHRMAVRLVLGWKWVDA